MSQIYTLSLKVPIPFGTRYGILPKTEPFGNIFKPPHSIVQKTFNHITGDDDISLTGCYSLKSLMIETDEIGAII